MWKLTIEDDQGNRIPVPLVRDDYSIGRAAENTLRLTERNVSRKHASLRQDAGRWFLLDLDSYNGCYVNGERVTEQQELANGDLIQLGDYRIEIFEEADAPVMVAEPVPVEEIVPAAAPSLRSEVAEIEADASMQGVEIVPEESPGPAHFHSPPLENADEIPGVPKRRKAGMGMAAGVAILALGGVAFALLRSDPPAPTESRSVALAEVAPAPPAPNPQPAQPAEEAEIALARAEVPEPELEVVEELPEAPAAALMAPADTKPQAAPARVAVAKADEKPRTAAAAPPKSQTSGERRPVLAANPFDSPSSGGGSTSTKAASGSKSLTELAAQGSEGEAKMRPILEQRVASGKATTNDIKLLRAICRNMGDRVCADRMTALLAQQK